VSSPKKIFAISGSTRQNSTNHNLIKAIAIIFAGKISIELFEGLAALPAFNPDDTSKDIPEVNSFRQSIADADGIIICTPEYAHGVPGALKNAIDWTVSSNEFYHKPTALITASTDGTSGHAALLETLKTIEAKNILQLQLLIQFAKTKIGEDNTITDEATAIAVKQLVEALIATIEETKNHV
jgi:chromate reductase, NAD(P)H dehydrogenase (quinone)